MRCGDCDFETHYESELFLHLKVHIGKEDEVLQYHHIYWYQQMLFQTGKATYQFMRYTYLKLKVRFRYVEEFIIL